MAFQNRSAYGEIFSLPTQYIDGIANKLYAEHKQRQAQQQQEIKGMDDMFSKNVSGVRDEDIPDIVQSYNKWKTAKIGLAKNPNSKDRIQKELEANREMANTFQQIGNSKQMLKVLQDNGKKVAAKPDDHTDDAPTLIASTNGVPTSKFNTLLRPDPNGEIDPSTGKVKMVGFDPADYNSYVDRGNVKNWQPIMKNAVGQLKDVTPISEDYKDDKGVVLGKQVTPIKATASPTSYMANMSQYVYSGVGRLKHFTNSFKNSYTDENATKIATEYYDQAKNNPLWKQAWGENGVAIPPEALANPNTRVLALNSMEYALNNPPQLGKPTNVPNVVGVTKNKQDFASSMQEDRQRHAEAMQLQGFKNALARQENAARLGLYKDKEGTPAPPNILDEFTVEFGEKYREPLSGADMTIVDVKNIPVKYRPLLSTSPMKVGDKEFYVVDETGSYIGIDKQVITPVSVADNYIKTYGNTKFKLEGRKKFLQAEQNQAPTQKQPPAPKKETPSNKPAAKPKKDPLNLGF